MGNEVDLCTNHLVQNPNNPDVTAKGDPTVPGPESKLVKAVHLAMFYDMKAAFMKAGGKIMPEGCGVDAFGNPQPPHLHVVFKADSAT